jgi:hypothetical protein
MIHPRIECHILFGGGVRLSPLGKSATNWSLVPALLDDDDDDDDDDGAVSRMRIGKGNRSTWIKPVPVPLSPPQIPHDLTWARTVNYKNIQKSNYHLNYAHFINFTSFILPT